MNPIRRSLIGLALAALASACADDGMRSAPAPGVTINFGDPALAENARPTIEVVSVTRRALLRADLLLPDGALVVGTVVEGQAIAGQPGWNPGGAGVGVGVFGGSSGRVGSGVSIGVPIFGGGRPAEVLVRSRARIAPPDMDAYRRDWTQARVRLTYGIGADAERVDIPAPAPAAR
jgi:hypothetical protein